MSIELNVPTLIGIALIWVVVQFLVTRYYVASSIHANNQTNNKKIVRKISEQIDRTFDQYMGNGREKKPIMLPLPKPRVHAVPKEQEQDHDHDSIDDPMDEADMPNEPDDMARANDGANDGADYLAPSSPPKPRKKQQRKPFVADNDTVD
jgi:hypothetical protein